MIVKGALLHERWHWRGQFFMIVKGSLLHERWQYVRRCAFSGVERREASASHSWHTPAVKQQSEDDRREPRQRWNILDGGVSGGKFFALVGMARCGACFFF